MTNPVTPLDGFGISDSCIPLCDKDGIIDREHEKAGFAEGINVGIRWGEEMNRCKTAGA